MAKKTTAPVISQESQADFENLGNLVAIIDEGSARIDTLNAEINDTLRDEIDTRREEVTKLQGAVIEAKASAELLCKKHRHWFGGKQSLALLNGTCQFRASKGLTVPNEVASIKLIQAGVPAEDAKRYIRVSEELDKEALEKLPDEELAKFGLIRADSESFDVKPRKVDLAKAAAAEPNTEEAKAA